METPAPVNVSHKVWDLLDAVLHPLIREAIDDYLDYLDDEDDDDDDDDDTTIRPPTFVPSPEPKDEGDLLDPFTLIPPEVIK